MNRSRQSQGDHKGCLDPNRAPCGHSRNLFRLNRKQRERRERVTPCEVGGSRECGGGRARASSRMRAARPPGSSLLEPPPYLALTPAPSGLGRYFAGEVQKPKVRILCLRRRKRLSRSQWQGRSSLQKPLNSVPHLEVN
jgi:hypothetical protein